MSNLKLRLYLLVFVTTLPLIIYILTSRYQNYLAQREGIIDHLTQIASLASSEYKQIDEGARQLLIALSTSGPILSLSPTRCNSYLEDLKSKYVRYLNFGVVDESGQIICAANLPLALSNPPSSALIQQALSQQGFTIGSYYPLNPHGSVINYAYPLGSNHVIYTSLSLSWVSEFTNNFNAEGNNFVINILDQNGTVLARNPVVDQAVGQNFASDPLVQEILEKGSGQTTKLGIDNISRRYVFTSLDDNKSTYFAVGTSESDLYSILRKSLISDILILLAITTLTIFLTQQISQILLLKQIESLQALDKLKDEFVSLASHQIRSPLTAIRWLSESLLESKNNLKAKQQLSLGKIHATTLRLITLTSNLLSLSRLETGTLELRSSSINLRSFLNSLLTEHTTLCQSTQLQFKTNIPARLSLATDPHLLHEILTVLISNAIKYSTPHHAVTISATPTTDSIMIKVTNRGIGIPASAAPHLFTRFYRADNARVLHPDGNGLGLHLARLLAHKLGGTLTFSSTQSTTIFTLTLPNKV